MIIKSLSRKARLTSSFQARRGRLSGGGGGTTRRASPTVSSPFSALTRYMDRGIEAEEGEAVLWHNFYGSDGTSTDEIVALFEANATHLAERKNGNVLYHEILSFSAGHTLKREELLRMIADVGQEYLRERAPEQLAYGVVHLETDNAHLHLMISANRVNDKSRVRLSRKEFAEAQKATERYAITRYPELAQTPIYDRNPAERAHARAERVKGQAHEQAMKSRTGKPSQKDALKMRLHHLFEQAQSAEALRTLGEREGFRFYQRGKNWGIIERDLNGNDKKHRFSTLGVEPHYLATLDRFERAYGANSGQHRPSQSTPQTPPEPQMKPPLTPATIIEAVGQTLEEVDAQRSKVQERVEEEARFGKEVAKDFIFGTDRSDRRPNHEKPREEPEAATPTPDARPMTEAERRLKALDAAKVRARERDARERSEPDKDRGDRDR
jgi:hypothetical protein